MTKNYLPTDLVEIDDAKGTLFILFTGVDEPKAECQYDYGKIPTWETLIEDLIEYCNDNNICLNYVMEQGTLQQGPVRVKLPPVAVEIIISHILHA